ncbi:MAG: FKBP-type peptidyl-prolyl cis-trans isomerase [Tepidisphaeraceae bacterium]
MKIRSLVAVLALLASATFAAEPASQPVGAKTGKTEATPSGLQITHGEAGTGAADGDTVYVLYTGKLQDGTVFDSTTQRGDDPIEFILGQAMVIKGWDEGIKGMLVGETRTLVIPPAIAYGPEGRPPVIPPNATLTFDVKLVGIRRPTTPKAPAPTS